LNRNALKIFYTSKSLVSFLVSSVENKECSNPGALKGDEEQGDTHGVNWARGMTSRGVCGG